MVCSLTLVFSAALAQNAPPPADNADKKSTADAIVAAPADAKSTAKPAPPAVPSPDASVARPAKAAAKPAPEPSEPQAPEPEAGQLLVEISYGVDTTKIQGNRDRSFLNAGINHTAELTFFQERPAFGNRRLELLAVGRYTDNFRTDPERNSLQRGYAKLTGQSFEATLGDALANYSRLTMNQNIKGLHLRKDLHPRLRAFGVAGYFTDRWGSLYRDYLAFRDVRLDCTGSLPGQPAPGCIEFPPGSGQFIVSPENPGKPYSRLSTGARLEWKLVGAGLASPSSASDSWIALNWSHGKDLLQSLPEARVICEDTLTGFRTVRPISPGCGLTEVLIPTGNRPSREAFNNDVLGTDVNLNLVHGPLRTAPLRVRGEFVTSWTAGGNPPPGAAPDTFVCASQSPIIGGAVLDQRCFPGQVADWALKMEANQRVGKLNWRADLLRFQPNFYSANARQIRDLQDFIARGDYQFHKIFSAVISWRRSSDNLNGQRSHTFIVQAPEARLLFRDIPQLPNLRFWGGYRERTVRAVGNPSPTERRDRTNHIPFAGFDYQLPQHFGAAQITFDYERRNDEDKVRPQLASLTHSYAFGIRSNNEWRDYSLRAFLRFEMERLGKYQPGNPAQSLTDPSLLFPADFLIAHDTGRSMQAGFSLEAPKYWRLEAQAREYNAVILSALQASAALDPARNFYYLNQGFKRPSWRALFTFKVNNDENKLLTASYSRFNNFFNPGDPFVADLKSFRETIIGGSLILRFSK